MNELATTDNKTLEPKETYLPVDIAWPDLQAAIAGNLNKLTAEGQVKYYNALCKFTGLNPLGFPFEWITFQGKLRLYPKKECADQLRGVHKITAKIIDRTFVDDICMVRVLSKMPDGREFESTGAVPYTKSMPALEKCKALKVAETQAYRRGTFGLVGLGNLPDEDSGGDTPVSVVTEQLGEESASARADRLNKTLTAGEKEGAIDLEHLPANGSPPIPSPVLTSMPAPVVENLPPTVSTAAVPPGEVKTQFSTPPAEPKPEDDFSTTGASSNPPEMSAAEKLALELQTVFAENKNCVAYIVAQNKLAKGADIATIDKVYAEKILKFPQRFLAAVEQWAKGGGK